jgi:hypothetical protein
MDMQVLKTVAITKNGIGLDELQANPAIRVSFRANLSFGSWCPINQQRHQNLFE